MGGRVFVKCYNNQMNNHPFQCLGLASVETARHFAFEGTEEYTHGEGLATGSKGMDRIQLLLSLTSC